MNSGSRTFKIIAGILFLLILFYFGISILSYSYDPLSTTVTYRYVMEDTRNISGYLIRDEAVLASQDGILSLTREEGERVGVGQAVAVVYDGESAREDEDTLEALQLRLQQLQHAQDVAANAEVALKLDSTILQSIYRLQSGVAAGEASSLSDEVLDLKTLIMKRDYTAADGESLAGEIRDLKKQVSSLKSQLSKHSSSVRVAASGIYSAVVDGYETVLTPEMLSQLTPEMLSTLQPDKSLQSNVGKIIYGSRWYYAFVIDHEDAILYPQGSSVKLRFAKNADRDYTMQVHRLGDNVDGKHVVVLSCGKYLSELTLLRDPSAQSIHETVTGLRVPTAALRMAEDGTLGVYCRIGKEAYFKPVVQCFAGDGFYLVQAADGVSETRTLREGDEVIVSANDLYDGKVIN